MKLVYFAFNNRYRFKDLNNFIKSRLYRKHLVLNLAGPFRSFIAKIFLKLNFGFAISCDARPLITNEKKGINFFVRGTNLNIPIRYRYLKNNFVSINNPFEHQSNLFQVYPINIQNCKMKKKMKIIYASQINLNTTELEKNLWNEYKKEIIKDFTIIDKQSFWDKILNEEQIVNKYIYYRKFKLLLRFEIVKYLKTNFHDKFELIGDLWLEYFKDTSPSNFNQNYLKNLYKGNLCLDLGSIEGSSSLYSRSNQIIESGGLIIQAKQVDYKDKWNKLEKKILFRNFDDLTELINCILNNYSYSNQLLQEISQNFSSSKDHIEQNLEMILKVNN